MVGQFEATCIVLFDHFGKCSTKYTIFEIRWLSIECSTQNNNSLVLLVVTCCFVNNGDTKSQRFNSWKAQELPAIAKDLQSYPYTIIDPFRPQTNDPRAEHPLPKNVPQNLKMRKDKRQGGQDEQKKN